MKKNDSKYGSKANLINNMSNNENKEENVDDEDLGIVPDISK